MKKLFLGFIMVSLANSILQIAYANEQKCDPSDIENSTQYLIKRERLAQKGLALYSNPNELEELNRNFKSAVKFELASKMLFTFSLYKALSLANGTLSRTDNPFLIETITDMTPFIGMTVPVLGFSELVRFLDKAKKRNPDFSKGGFKIFDEAHQQLTIRRQEKTGSFDGTFGRVKNSLTLGSTGTDAQWALRMEYVGHGELYRNELEYIKLQRDILARAKQAGVCDHNEDISRASVNERQELIDAIDEMMDLRQVKERNQAEKKLI